jgi:hypothetical protein
MIIARCLPFTLLFLVAMVLANWLVGTLTGALPSGALADWGISHHSVREGELFRLVTGTFLSHDLSMFMRQIVFAAVIVGAYEWLEGTWRALAMFVVVDILGTLLVLFVILPWLSGSPVNLGAEIFAAHDVGMSAGGFGLVGALIARHRYGWIVLLATIVAILIKVWVAFDPIADTAHLLCLMIGFGLQMLLVAQRLNRNVAKR